MPDFQQADELLIWTPDGVWFQHRGEDGRIHSNWMGFQRLDSIRAFAKAHGILFEAWEHHEEGKGWRRGLYT